jgi:hypothetical protein
MKKFIALITLMLILSGCANMNGGMPTIPFDPEAELGVVTKDLAAQSSVKIYYDAPTLQNRNKFISTRLIMTNIAYIRFIKDMSAEEAQLHSATDILVVSLDVAAAAAAPVNAKTIMSGLSSIIGGSRLALDKNTFHEKTMSALISSMNAQRKEVLARILQGSGASLEGYSFEQALSDLNDYYLSGSIPGALSAIQKDAGAKEVKADDKINLLMVKRDSGFLDAASQMRVNNLLDAVAKLSAVNAIDIGKTPPVTDAFTELSVSRRDPTNRRLTDSKAAIEIIKMRIILSQRDEKSLGAWEAAVKAAQ